MRVSHQGRLYFRSASLALCLSLVAAGCASVKINPEVKPKPRVTYSKVRTFADAAAEHSIKVRTAEGVALPVSTMRFVQTTYARFGVVIEDAGFSTTDSIVESAPVVVAERQVVYRLRRSTAGPNVMFLEAVLVSGDNQTIVRNEGRFGEAVWKPISAVANHFYPLNSASTAIRWRPAGCGPSSTMISCL